MKEYILIGNGGYAKVVTDLIEKLNGNIVQIYNSDDDYKENHYPNAEVVIAIGNNECRQRIAAKIKHPFATLVHPSAVVSHHVNIGTGSVVLANAVIQADTQLGNFVIVQPNATIDHEVIIENYVMVYPGAYIGSEAKITQLKTIKPNGVVERYQVI